jgi:hypothetical protein
MTTAHDTFPQAAGPPGPSTSGRVTAVVLRIELVAVAGTFLVFALLHAGVHVVGVAEPQILVASVVEAVCGLSMAVAAAAALAGSARAWPAAVAANAISATGVVLGIVAQARGTGPTELNFVYHRGVLVVLLASLALLLTRWGRAALPGGARHAHG